MEFIFNQKSQNLLRDADITIAIISGEKNKSLTKKYQVSATTIINAYRKVCRRMYYS